MISLSEAIRLGSHLNGQAKGTFNDGKGGTCALGSVAWVKGISLSGPNLMQSLYDAFPLLKRVVVHPVQGKPTDLGHAIMSLNDHHNWSREAIADFVAHVEKGTSVEKATAAARG